MTLNGVVAVILRYFTEFGTFGAIYVTVVNVIYIICNVAQRISFQKYDLWQRFRRLLKRMR